MAELTYARCTVQDKESNQVPLEYLAMTGVHYDQKNDRLECLGPQSCTLWTISDCHVVHCAGEQSCLGTSFIGNQGISCVGDKACFNARMFESQNVACGMGDASTNRPCSYAFIEVDTALLCFGVNACVSDYGEHMTVRTGLSGLVRCDNNSGQGEAATACRNMVVEVKHSRRACYAKSISEATSVPSQQCAFVCENNAGECDKETIRFRTQ
ncbi:hypothetical protein ACA910_012542 [Epithemia clementina (nom. ined.)]